MSKNVNWILFFIFFVVLELLICEIYLRIFMPQIGGMSRKEEIIGWVNDEYRKFNPNTPKKERFKKRILFLGDSFLAGAGISHADNRFPVILKKRLNNSIDITILAAGGWSTDQQLLAFLLKGKEWKPDIVVVGFCSNNDISEILSYDHTYKKARKPFFVINKEGELDLFNGFGNLIDYKNIKVDSQSFCWIRSYLMDFVTYKFRQTFYTPKEQNIDKTVVDEKYGKFSSIDEKPGEIYRKQEELSWSPQMGVTHVSAYIHEDFKINRYQWSLLERILHELKMEVADVKAKLVVILLPVIFDTSNLETVAGGDFEYVFKTPAGVFTFRSAEPRDRLSKICKKLDIIFYDPSFEFIKYVRDNKLIKKVWPNPGDRHFSDIGHKILADFLLREMRD